VLKNKAIVDEAEKLFKEFKPVTYDVDAHVRTIEAFESKAVRRSFRGTPLDC
jgi:F-type H+-transporting ATPase subunit d